MRSRSCTSAVVALGMGCIGCSIRVDPEILRPQQVMEFAALYQQNCAGCHGEQGMNGAAISLANPVYLVASGEAAIRKAVAKGVPSTLMPAFETSAGGSLTTAQVDSLVQGMFQKWSRADALGGAHPPSYTSELKGDPAQGQKAFAAFCGRCHGPGGAGVQSTDADAVRGSIVESSYLALLSDQSLRSTIIAGRPEQGMPDWRSDIAGHAMTDQKVTDVVAWLATFRRKVP